MYAPISTQYHLYNFSYHISGVEQQHGFILGQKLSYALHSIKLTTSNLPIITCFSGKTLNCKSFNKFCLYKLKLTYFDKFISKRLSLKPFTDEFVNESNFINSSANDFDENFLDKNNIRWMKVFSFIQNISDSESLRLGQLFKEKSFCRLLLLICQSISHHFYFKKWKWQGKE